MIDDADCDFLVRLVLGEEMQVFSKSARALEGDDVGVKLEEVGDRALVGGTFPEERLLIRIAPTRMYPDFGLDAGDFAVEGVGQKL